MQRISISVGDITSSNYIWKNSCAAATTTNVTTTSLVGSVVDGYTVLSTDRILVKSQSTVSQNGVYLNNLIAVDSDVDSGFSVYYIVNGTTNGGSFFYGTAGSTFNNLFLNGTVKSVGLTAPSIFSVSGSPVTTSGTLALSLASQAANTVFAAPNGSAGTPTFRALVNADLQNSTISVVTGTSGTGFNISGSPVSLGGTLTINLPDASATADGTVNTGAQTFAGAKTFASAPTFTGFTAGSVLFAGTSGLLSQNNSDLFWDNTNNRLGILTATPSQLLHVAGNARLTGALYDGSNSAGTAGYVLSSTGTATSWVSAFNANGLQTFSAESAVATTTTYPSYTSVASFSVAAATSGSYSMQWYCEFGTIASGSFAQIVGSVSGTLATMQNNMTSTIASIGFLSFSGIKILTSYTGSETITFQLCNAANVSTDPANMQRMRLVLQRVA